MVAKTLGFVFTFLFPLLLVRFVDKTQFGLYRQSFLIVNTSLNILPLGLGVSVFYFLPREPERKRQVVFNILLFHLLMGGMALAVLWIRPQVLELLFGSRELVAYGHLIGLVICTWMFGSFLETVATAYQEVKLSTIFIITAQFTKGLFMLTATLLRPSVEALLHAAILQGLVQSAILLWYLESRFPGYWRVFDWRFLRAQLSYAVPLGLAGMVYALFDDVHHYFVSKWFGPAAYAVYAVGCFQVPFVGLVREAIGNLMIARVSYLQRHGSARDIVELNARVTHKLAMMYWGVYFLMLVVSRELITVLYTSRYLDSWPIFLVNLSLLPMGIAMYDPVLRAYSELRFFVLRVRLMLVVALMVTLWAGLDKFGVLGAIAVVMAVHLLERTIMIARVSTVLGMTRPDWRELRDVLKIGLAAAAAGAPVFALRWVLAGHKPVVTLLACAVFYAAAYPASLWLARVPTEDDKEILQRQWARLRAWLRP